MLMAGRRKKLGDRVGMVGQVQVSGTKGRAFLAVGTAATKAQRPNPGCTASQLYNPR